MLYNLYEYLKDFVDFPGLGLFKYITFRAFSAVIISLIISFFVGKRIINLLIKRQIKDEIRELGIGEQQAKRETPTMGGIIILTSILIPSILLGDLRNIYVQLLILTTLWLGLIGFADDYIKVFKKRKDGLKSKFKIYGQISLGLIVGISLYLSDDAIIREPLTRVEKDQQTEVVTSNGEEPILSHYRDLKSTKTTIPFVKNNEFDYSWLAPLKGQAKEIAGWIIYIIAIIFIITAVSNGTNLTDGMDGLATGVSAIVGTTLGILAYLSGNIIYAGYLNIMYLPNTGEIVIVLAAFIGALVGFLWYNSYPAQIFMGDTGSLAIGGIIAVSAIMIRKELLIPILCGIFFVESLSVIVQRYYFKYTRIKRGKGVRIFRMTPLHHHFQKENPESIIQVPHKLLPESKIVVRFWIIAIFLAILTVITLKIR